MSSTAFVNAVSVSTKPVTQVTDSTCSTFMARPVVTTPVVLHRAATIMCKEYVIQQSEYVDSGGEDDDDMGDGFIGEADMDDMIGVSMPEDLAVFERNEIMNAESRDQLVDKLREIKERRKDIIVDRRKGMGMDNVGNYLGQL